MRKNHKNLIIDLLVLKFKILSILVHMKDFQLNRLKVCIFNKNLKRKYHIKSKNFLGHSDIAPDRKKDPGEKFPWKDLARHKIGIWYKSPKKNLKLRNAIVTLKEKNSFYINLKKIGYCLQKKPKHLKSVIRAFQRRYRPKIINGKIDKECFEIAKNLVKLGLN